MANWYEREFASLEQALQAVVRNLSEESIKNATGKTKDYFLRVSDPREDSKRHLQHRDSIKLDIECLREGKGHPILNAHQAQVDKFLKSSNKQIDIKNTILGMQIRLGYLTEDIQKALDPSGPSGEKIDRNEKDDLSKKILKLEEKIADLKISIGLQK